MSDRFGDYGLIGVVIFTAAEASIVVESFLMSCRALGRRVEHTILVQLCEEARKMGLVWVDVQFSASTKNAPAFNFLESLPAVSRTGTETSATYRLSADGVAEPRICEEATAV